MGMWPFLKLFSNLCLNWAISAGRVWMYKQMHHDSQMHFNSDYNTHKYKDYCMMGRLCKNLQHFMPMPDFVKNCWPGLECVHPQAAKRPVALDVERFTHRPVRAAAGPSPAGDLATTALWPPTSRPISYWRHPYLSLRLSPRDLEMSLGGHWLLSTFRKKCHRTIVTFS